MSYSPITVTATGSPQNINLPWDYIERTHVVVRANGTPLVTDVDYTWSSPSTFSITRPAGETIEVTRSSSLTQRLTDYTDGVPLPEVALDVDSKQPLYLLQEIEADTIQLETRIIAIETGAVPIPGITGVAIEDDGVDVATVARLNLRTGITAELDGDTINIDVAAADPGLNSDTTASTDYTFVLGDANRMKRFTASTAVTARIPDNSAVAFPVGTVLHLLQYGTGKVTVGIAGSAVIRNSASAATRAQYSVLTVHKIGTDEWVLFGDMQ